MEERSSSTQSSPNNSPVGNSPTDPMEKTFFDVSLSSTDLLDPEGELVSTCERVYPGPEHQTEQKSRKKKLFGWLGLSKETEPVGQQPKKKHKEDMNAHLDRINGMGKKSGHISRGSGDAARIRALM